MSKIGQLINNMSIDTQSLKSKLKIKEYNKAIGLAYNWLNFHSITVTDNNDSLVLSGELKNDITRLIIKDFEKKRDEVQNKID